MKKYKKYISLLIIVAIIIFLYSTFKSKKEDIPRQEDLQITQEEPITTQENTNLEEENITVQQPVSYINIPESGTYSSKITNLSFTYPTEWMVVLDNEALTSIMSPNNTDAINIGIIPMDNKNIEEFSTNIGKEISKKFPEAQPQFAEIDINGKKVYSALYDYTSNNEKIYETLLYYVDDKNNLIVISYATKNETSEELEKILGTISF